MRAGCAILYQRLIFLFHGVVAGTLWFSWKFRLEVCSFPRNFLAEFLENVEKISLFIVLYVLTPPSERDFCLWKCENGSTLHRVCIMHPLFSMHSKHYVFMVSRVAHYPHLYSGTSPCKNGYIYFLETRVSFCVNKPQIVTFKSHFNAFCAVT